MVEVWFHAEKYVELKIKLVKDLAGTKPGHIQRNTHIVTNVSK